MPYKEFKIEKLYYPIGEVAKMFDVSTSLIRYWEKEFDILKPRKNKKGNRLFTKVDVENLKIIYHLVKEKGYTLEGAKQKLRSDSDDIRNTQKVVDSLIRIKGFLNEVKNDL
ncbi:MAG: DNA-binding transcriptional MerR regulator [Chitinophagales bacterium]